MVLSVAVTMFVLPSAQAFAVGAPTIVSPGGGVAGTWSAEIGYTTATIKALVNPNGAATTYRFEYGADTSYGTSVPVPDGELGSGTKGVEVSQHLTSINAGTTYHYRVVAVNAEGTIYGPDEIFTTFAATGAGASEACPNEAFRVGVSATLPDCRAYEMVSPVGKNGSDINGQEYKEFWASHSGERIQFPTRTGLDGTHGSGTGGYTQFVAARSPAGWTSTGVTPTPALNTPLMLFVGGTTAIDFSNELERAIVGGYALPGVQGAVPEKLNVYLENALTGNLIEPLTRFEAPEEPVAGFAAASGLGGGSKDFGVTAFESPLNLVAPASGTSPKVYALNHGKLHLVGILPDGSVPPGGSMDVRESRGAAQYNDTVSVDGSRIFFTSPADGSAEPQLYMRKNESATVWISESEGSMSVTEPHNVHFQAATADGTKVVFSTNDRLTDSDPGGPGTALYLYTDGPKPEQESNLTFIGRFTGISEGDIEGEVVKGISEDGSRIYFDSEYNPGALPFDTVGTGFFLWDKGQLRQIAPTPDAVESSAFNSNEEAEVSPDGHQIVFMNDRRLTANDVMNLPIVQSTNDTELYLYDESTNSLKCVSCPQNGAAATWGVEYAVEATSQSNPGFSVFKQPRFFSENGKYVFFNTREALVPQDTNGLPDAYEYNVETGKLSLLSSGTGEYGTWFVDASADGRDAFVITRQKLNASDPDKLVDLYDARIHGGFAEPPAPSLPCVGDECQGIPSPVPSFSTASGFNGLGNSVSPLVVKPKAKKLTRAQGLRAALRACQKKRKKARPACRKAARKRLGAKASVTRTHRRAGR